MKNFTFLKPFIDNFIDTFHCSSDFICTISVWRGNCPKNTFPVILMILVDVCLRIPRWNMMLNVPKYLHLYVYNVSVKYNIVHYPKIKIFKCRAQRMHFFCNLCIFAAKDTKRSSASIMHSLISIILKICTTYAIQYTLYWRRM